MIKDADQEGRYPLSNKEYFTIRQIFGLISGLDLSLDYLRDRAKLMPGTWRDLRMILSVSDKAVTNLLKTVPTKKLQQIKAELSKTVVSVEVKDGLGLPQPKKESFCYVPSSALMVLIENTLEWQCFTCQKTPKEAKKCPHRKAIDDVFPYEQSGKTEEYCKYSGMHLEAEYEEE